MKFQYFQEEWKERPEWIAFAEETVQNVWETAYKGYTNGGAGERRPLEEEEERDVDAEEDLTRWERKLLAAAQVAAGLDMLQRFQQEKQVVWVRDVVGWWHERLLDPQWKDLARMALTYLTLPAMSAEPERVFGAAKQTLSDRRCRVGDDVLEAVECLKRWQRDGIVAPTQPDAMEIGEMLAALSEEDRV